MSIVFNRNNLRFRICYFGKNKKTSDVKIQIKFVFQLIHTIIKISRTKIVEITLLKLYLIDTKFRFIYIHESIKKRKIEYWCFMQHFYSVLQSNKFIIILILN